jgi:hypothetical protein
MQADLKLNIPQSQFIAMPHKYRAFVAGFGTGKTVTGCVSSLIHYWEHPKVNQGYFAPTYPQIRDIYFPTIEEVAYGMGLRVDIKEGNKEVHIYSGRFYRGTTICRSIKDPSSIIGFKIGKGHIDELDVLATRKAKEAWRKVIARLRWQDETIKNGVDVTTTPEGFKEVYRLFVEMPQLKPELKQTYAYLQASTYDNAKNLPDDYIQSLLDTYPTELIDAYLRGQFVNLTSGTVYRSFNRKLHNSDELATEHDVLRTGMDFNVTKMASTVYVVRPNGWHAVSEFKDVFDTPDMIRAIRARFPTNRVIVYPDASGDSRKTVDASKSDISLLRQANFEVRVNSQNPPVKDRIMAVNKQFEKNALFVNVKQCPTVAKHLEQQAYNDNGEPDKKAGFDHQNDATGYPIAYEFPIARNNFNRLNLSGV